LIFGLWEVDANSSKGRKEGDISLWEVDANSSKGRKEGDISTTFLVIYII